LLDIAQFFELALVLVDEGVEWRCCINKTQHEQKPYPLF
jgi:hypothetical protein